MNISHHLNEEEEFYKLFNFPWHFKNNAMVAAFWRSSQLQACGQLRKEASLLLKSAEGDLPLESTRKKLRKLAQAKNQQAKTLDEILAPLESYDDIVKKMGYEVLSGLFFKQDLLSYFDNIHRDWAWGDEENRLSIEIIKSCISENFQKTAVLGSGASRLAFDFHQEGLSSETIAIDINPLLLESAKRVIFGKGLKLYDFPIAPASKEDSLVQNKMTIKEKPKEGLSLLMADATVLPFEGDSLDCVVTPWLVDILSCGAEALLKEVHRVLKPGGTWLFFGPLGFTHQAAKYHYSKEEFVELSELAGFSLKEEREEVIPYMDNPHSHHGRREKVACRKFIKENEFNIKINNDNSVEWLQNTDRAIPLSHELEVLKQTHQVYATVLSFVDGRTPLKGIAKDCAPLWGLSEEETLASLIRFFSRLQKSL